MHEALPPHLGVGLSLPNAQAFLCGILLGIELGQGLIGQVGL